MGVKYCDICPVGTFSLHYYEYLSLKSGCFVMAGASSKPHKHSNIDQILTHDIGHMF